MKKIIALCLSVLMLFALCACGDNGEAGGSAKEIAGETQTSGNITVFVPEGMKVVPGDMFDEENPDALTVEMEDDAFTYVIITIDESDSIDENLGYTKDFNDDCEFVDFNQTLANGTFTGFTYESWGVNCAGLKGEIGGAYVQISAAGFEADDASFLKILESIVVSAS